MVEITEVQNKVKRMKIIDNIKCTTIQIIGVPEEEEKNKRSEKNFEVIIVKRFL